MNGVAVAEAVARPELTEGSVASVLYQKRGEVEAAVAKNFDSKPITLDGTNPQIGNYQLTIARLLDIYTISTWEASFKSNGIIVNSATGPEPRASFDNLLQQLDHEQCFSLKSLNFSNGRKAVSA